MSPLLTTSAGLGAEAFGFTRALRAGGSFEQIATVTIASTGQAEFLSIPNIYKHLQVRIVGRSTSDRSVFCYFNNDFATAAASHDLRNTTTSVTSSNYTGQVGAGVQDLMSLSTDTAQHFGVAVIEILDYADTTKAKTVRFIGGHTSSGGSRVNIASGVWLSTNAINRLLVTGGNGYAVGSRITLYGIRG